MKIPDFDNFLETYVPPKLNQGDTHNLNRSISSNEIEEGIKSLPSKKIPGPDGLSDKFYKIFKEELIPTLPQVQEIEREEILPNSFYEANITLIPKLGKDISRKENFRLIFLINVDECSLMKYWQTISKKYYENCAPQLCGFHLWNTRVD